MAIRRWAARPDQALVLNDGTELPVVSREQMRDLYMDAEAMMAQGGGVVTVFAQRARTDLDGEMVTTMAVFEWKDRTDAKPQPERAAAPAAPAPEPEPAAEPDVGAQLEELVDGDPAAEPDEDMSSIPAHLQGVV